MKRTLLGLAIVLTVLVAASTSPSVRGCGYGMPSPLARFALADCVVLGEVAVYEDQPVESLPFANSKEKAEYRVAVIRVLQAPKLDDDVTHIRLGLLQHQHIPLGFKGCFFLQQHHQEAFYAMQTFFDYAIPLENNPGFAKQMEQFQAWGKLMKDPVAGLRSKSPADRLTTAALMLSRYRPPLMEGVSGGKFEPIDRTESRLILETLAGADWNQPGLDFRVTPRRLFQQLGLTEKDGWNPQGKTAQEFDAAAKNWLDDNASTFRITTRVP